MSDLSEHAVCPTCGRPCDPSRDADMVQARRPGGGGMTRRLRRPGSPWRILVHTWIGRAKGQTLYGTAHHVSSDRRFGGGDGADSKWSRHVEIPGTEFDELVVGCWLHLEAMDSGVWWMDVGGVTVLVTADREGRPKRVSVYGPGDYADPVPGCEYGLTWSGEPA